MDLNTFFGKFGFLVKRPETLDDVIDYVITPKAYPIIINRLTMADKEQLLQLGYENKKGEWGLYTLFGLFFLLAAILSIFSII